jgi:hypothetical protein
MITMGGCVDSEPVAGGAEAWFEYWDDGFDGDPLDEDEHAFLAGLRARATAGWPCDPEDTFSYHDLRVARVLKICVGRNDPVSHTALIKFGIVFDGKRIVGNRVDFAEPFDVWPLEAAAMTFSGSLESLVQRAGEWFEWLLTWPIERREWFDWKGQPAHCEWILSNIDFRLVGHSPYRMRRPGRVTLIHGVRDR